MNSVPLYVHESLQFFDTLIRELQTVKPIESYLKTMTNTAQYENNLATKSQEVILRTAQYCYRITAIVPINATNRVSPEAIMPTLVCVVAPLGVDIANGKPYPPLPKLGEVDPMFRNKLVSGDLTAETWQKVLRMIVANEIIPYEDDEDQYPALESLTPLSEASMTDAEDKTESKRPPWPFSFKESDVRFFEASVTNVESDGSYEKDNWTITLINEKDQKLTLDINNALTRRLVWFPRYCRAGVCDLPKDDPARKKLRVIDRYDKKFDRDWVEYQRLKKRFGDQEGD